MRCEVTNCKSNTKEGALNISFFNFPKNAELAEKWALFCCRDDNLTNGRICSEHFAPEDIENNMEYEMGKKLMCGTENVRNYLLHFLLQKALQRGGF